MLGKYGSVNGRKVQSHKAGGETDGHQPALMDSILYLHARTHAILSQKAGVAETAKLLQSL